MSLVTVTQRPMNISALKKLLLFIVIPRSLKQKYNHHHTLSSTEFLSTLCFLSLKESETRTSEYSLHVSPTAKTLMTCSFVSFFRVWKRKVDLQLRCSKTSSVHRIFLNGEEGGQLVRMDVRLSWHQRQPCELREASG